MRATISIAWLLLRGGGRRDLGSQVLAGAAFAVSTCLCYSPSASISGSRTVAGKVTAAGLSTPNELLVVIGVEPGSPLLHAPVTRDQMHPEIINGTATVTGFATRPDPDADQTYRGLSLIASVLLIVPLLVYRQVTSVKRPEQAPVHQPGPDRRVGLGEPAGHLTGGPADVPESEHAVVVGGGVRNGGGARWAARIRRCSHPFDPGGRYCFQAISL